VSEYKNLLHIPAFSCTPVRLSKKPTQQSAQCNLVGVRPPSNTKITKI
jgi:hypothetical protein